MRQSDLTQIEPLTSDPNIGSSNHRKHQQEEDKHERFEVVGRHPFNAIQYGPQKLALWCAESIPQDKGNAAIVTGWNRRISTALHCLVREMNSWPQAKHAAGIKLPKTFEAHAHNLMKHLLRVINVSGITAWTLA